MTLITLLIMVLLAVIQTFNKIRIINQARFYFLDLGLLLTAVWGLLAASQWSNVRGGRASIPRANRPISQSQGRKSLH